MGFFEDMKKRASQPKKAKPIQVIKPQGRLKKFLINMGITLLVGFVYFYIKLPAINLQSEDFYFFFFILSGVYCVCAIVTSGIWKLRGQDNFGESVKTNCKWPLLVCAAFLVTILVGSFLSGVVIRSRAYRDLLSVETGDFTSEVEQISYGSIPMLDLDSARRLGDRKLGELADMVSQFEVADDYAQINYQGRPVRVTPLEYGDLVKWFNNRSKGLPAYIVVDMVTQNADVVRLDEGMRYTTTEHFSRNLFRHLRFQYPTFMFYTPVFEIDESGVPYWVCPRIVKRIGLFGGEDIHGAVLVNAITGESTYYEDVPTWVDRVYAADLIVEQYDYHGLYVNGFLNSIFGQKGVTVTTDGYNYIAMKDDVYMYTGITSVGSDQSNIGFILTNQRTKETKYYEIAGATEYSAMASAEGVVQHLAYKATFPLLLNISGQPTYFMSLKDNAGLVKMYAMVNVAQYQIVATGSTVAECEQNYDKLMKNNNIETAPAEGSSDGVYVGVVEDVKTAVIEGNTRYYFKLDSSDAYFSLSAAEYETAAILKVGDTVRVTCYVAAENDAIIPASSFEYVSRAALVPPIQLAPVSDGAQQTPDEDAPAEQPTDEQASA